MLREGPLKKINRGGPKQYLFVLFEDALLYVRRADLPTTSRGGAAAFDADLSEETSRHRGLRRGSIGRRRVAAAAFDADLSEETSRRRGLRRESIRGDDSRRPRRGSSAETSLRYARAVPNAEQLELNHEFPLTELVVGLATHNKQDALSIKTPAKSFLAIGTDGERVEAWRDAIAQAADAARQGAAEPDPAAYAPVWTTDKEGANCTNCGKSFTSFDRRHHCRKCGDRAMFRNSK